MVEKYKIFIEELENCTINQDYNNWCYDFTIIVTANEGYDFQSNTPFIEYADKSGNHFYPEFEKISDTVYQIEYEGTSDRVFLTAIATKSTDIKNKYGLVSIYNPSPNDLIKISKIRFESFSTSEGLQYIDTAQYLIALFRLYCKVEVVGRERVYFGKYDMQVDCPIVDGDILILDCGNVEIQEKYHNSIDYNNTDIEIYLPFIGFVTLKTTDFMNCSVNLKYQVNIINGDSLAILSVENNELLTQNCNISFKIPYTMEDNKKVYSEIDANHNYLNSLQPFLYIKRSILNDNRIKPYNKSSLWGKIGNFTGYSEINDVELSIQNQHITYTEIAEIKQLLANGVIL